MDPGSLHYLLTYGAVVTVVVVYLLWRPKKRPSRLKLRESQNQNKLDLVEFRDAPENTFRHERSLNIVFQYNGHDFDVYEVFGLPAGSPLEAVLTTYQSLTKETEAGTLAFYDTALRAAKAHFNRK
jgi:hypothetical protein